GCLPKALTISAALLFDTPTLPVDRYLAGLEKERLALLRDPDADPDDPEVSVEASLRLSWNLLTLAEQAALAQLGIFPAPFDLPAAQAVVADQPQGAGPREHPGRRRPAAGLRRCD